MEILHNLKKEELLKMKDEINAQLDFIEKVKSRKEKSKKGKLSSMERNEEIFFINFNGSKIYHVDYVKINFSKHNKYDDIMNFRTSHDSKQIGCHASLPIECMDHHCFLIEFYGPMYFFTLKPETWKEDLKAEQEKNIKRKRKRFNEEIKEFRKNISSFIKSNDILNERDQ